MEFNNVTTILLSGASICLGAFFGALRSKIFASKNRTKLHYSFYGFSILLFITSIIFLIVYWKEFLSPNWFGIVAFIIAILSSGALFYLTKKVLIVKDIYHTSELDPIVNNFTSVADKNEIKLFGGDLNFLGSTLLKWIVMVNIHIYVLFNLIEYQ